MISNAALQTILDTADDFTVVAEVYASDAAPPFDPSTAELLLAPIGGLTFAGEDYERKLVKFNKVKRTVSKEVNRCSVELDNIDGVLAAYELEQEFEGKILVLRLISRSQSDTLAKSLILFVGRCEKPDTATKSSITMAASQVVGAIDTEMPRRKYSYDDAEGRVPSDKLFEGFRYTPQYGTITYSKRKRLWYWSWLITRNLKKYEQYSSYSDIDANKFVPVVLGRAQMMGTHISYADVGRFLHTVTAFCEGPIYDVVNLRTDDSRFQFYDNSGGAAGYPALAKYEKRYGYAGGTGPTGRVQNTFSLGDFEGNGYYSKTAFLFGLLSGTDTLQQDPAPGIVGVVLGQLMTVPDGGGDWATSDKWSDNPAAHAYFVLTSDDYGRLDPAWIDEASFTEAYDYNNGVIYDASFADQIGTPDGSANFADGTTQLGRFMASTGLVTGTYFQYLSGLKGENSAFVRVPPKYGYTSGDFASLTGDPDEDPNPNPGPRTRNRNYTLRRRYTSNVIVTDSVKTADFLHDVVFGGSRMFLAQNEEGKLKLRHKKPVTNGIATGAVSTTSVSVDDASAFKDIVPVSVIIDPHTVNSEVRTVTAASYSTSTPSLSVTSTGSFITLTSFTGAGGSSPKTATVTVGTLAGVQFTVSLDGIDIDLGVFDDDTSDSLAGWIAASVNGHPELGRRFRADWTPGDNDLTISHVAGTLTLDSAPTMTHAAPLADATTAPTLTAASGGALAAGDIRVGYSYVNDRGETMMSSLATVTVTANQKITVTGVSLPTGATSVRWYSSVQAYGTLLRMVKENDGSGFDITALPKLTTKVSPSANTTGCELIEVSAVFSDRAEDRSGTERSNVIKGSFKWSLGQKTQPKNFVEVQFRDSTQDYRLTTLNLKDDAHIAKVKKTNKLTVNGSAIDNYNQAYRIAAGALAENLDANFLYQWTSDRTALLLEEGDVVAITDAGSGVVNLPVRIEEIEISMDGSFPTVSYTARKYSTSLYDDSVAERQIPVIIEKGVSTDFAP